MTGGKRGYGDLSDRRALIGHLHAERGRPHAQNDRLRGLNGQFRVQSER